MDYEPVIGLETHAELLTESKLWCRCATRFGQAPNTQTCPICLGMPGVLPVLNGRAFELALRAAVALGCTISRTTFFDRKNYYYPDLPKNYQVSQNYSNLGTDGRLEVPVDGTSRTVGITNVHLEEDAGKNLHAERPAAAGPAGADFSLVDLNRAGVPLLEIVSAPDMHSVAEADAYMQVLRQILLYTQVSDCKMQEGSLRFEASISMRPAGTGGLGARVEIKNLNSMKAVRGALEYEIRRQSKVLAEGGKVAQETRLWDEARSATARMRSKEEAQDYRYFPEPDLLPVQVTDEMIERVRSELPELPLARRRRFVEALGLSEYDAQVLTGDRNVADYFEECLRHYSAPKSIANWIMNVVLGQLNERGITVWQYEIQPHEMAELVKLVDQGKVNGEGARKVMAALVERARTAPPIVVTASSASQTQTTGVVTAIVELGVEQISDEDALAPVVDEVLAKNTKMAQDYLGGKQAALGALVGQVMRATRGKADPKLVNQLLRRKLDAVR
jgi:aspartyl-tRNA(Asn)/glutamyl-tRNA(Gln) amidotransferase subunit B